MNIQEREKLETRCWKGGIKSVLSLFSPSPFQLVLSFSCQRPCKIFEPREPGIERHVKGGAFRKRRKRGSNRQRELLLLLFSFYIFDKKFWLRSQKKATRGSCQKCLRGKRKENSHAKKASRWKRKKSASVCVGIFPLLLPKAIGLLFWHL